MANYRDRLKFARKSIFILAPPQRVLPPRPPLLKCCSCLYAQMLKCSNANAQMSNFIQMLLMLFICAHAYAQILTLLVLQMLLMLMLSCMVQILVHVHLMLIFDALDSTVLVYAHPV